MYEIDARAWSDPENVLYFPQQREDGEEVGGVQKRRWVSGLYWLMSWDSVAEMGVVIEADESGWRA